MDRINKMNNIYDVIVIGGGPSGMISAGRAGNLGKKVILLEKNLSLGKKLLITGGGRCNLTNTNTDLRKAYKESSKYLNTTFSQFNVEKTIKFFNEKGMKTKVEDLGRVFPVSNKSQSVLDVLVKYMEEGNVEVRHNSTVSKIYIEDNLFNIQLPNDNTILSKSCIIATGGMSYPQTGSTGDGFKWLKELGHNIIKNDFALVPISLKDNRHKKLSGLTLQDIKMSVYCDKKKEFSQKGTLLFTHFGISGPTVLNISKKVGDLLQKGTVTIMLDLFPSIDNESLRIKLNDILKKENNKMLKNTLGHLIPSSLVYTLLEIGGIDGNKFNNNVRREERIKIVDLMKGIPLNVDSLLGADKAIVSSGGVDINEVNWNTMESKKIKSLYLIGDILNIDRQSGGFSLQLCWTTGYVSGSNC